MNSTRGKASWSRGLFARFGAAFIAATVLMTGGLLFVEHEVEKTIANVKTTPVTTKPVAPTEPQNFLIIGSDSRDTITDPGEKQALGSDVGHRSDTMMVVRIDPGLRNVNIMSIPRDLPVTYLNGQTGKINAVFNDGDKGAQDVIDLLAAPPFNIPINHYVEIDFNGFKGLVDTVGDINMWFDAPTFDGAPGANGKWDTFTSFAVPTRGCYALNGEQARAFVRTRHYNEISPTGKRIEPGGGSDLERTQRQQLFMRKLAAKLLASVNGDYDTALDVTDKLLRYVTIDPSMKDDLRRELALIDIYGDLDPLDPNVVGSFTFPTTTVRKNGTYDIVADWGIDTQIALAPFRTPPEANSSTTTVPKTKGSTTTGAGATSAPGDTTISTTTAVMNTQVLPEKYMPDPIFIPKRVEGIDHAATCR